MGEWIVEQDIKNRNVVLGLGNLLCRDDGVGLHALKLLQERLEVTTVVEWVDGGVLGLDLLPLVEASRNLLVLDSIDAGQPAGTLIRMDRDEIPLFLGIKMSEHQVSFHEVLALAHLRDTLPEYLHLIGVQPGDTSLGLNLSPVVLGAVPLVVNAADQMLDQWGLTRAMKA